MERTSLFSHYLYKLLVLEATPARRCSIANTSFLFKVLYRSFIPHPIPHHHFVAISYFPIPLFPDRPSGEILVENTARPRAQQFNIPQCQCEGNSKDIATLWKLAAGPYPMSIPDDRLKEMKTLDGRVCRKQIDQFTIFVSPHGPLTG